MLDAHGRLSPEATPSPPARRRRSATGGGAARSALLGVVLLGTYLATLGFPASGGSRYAGEEPHNLLVAESIVADGDVDVADQHRDHAYADWHADALEPLGRLTADGRLHEPAGIGFPLLIAPAHALGGPVAVEVLVALLTALGFVLAAVLARRLVPEPWATRSVLVVALSPPALAGATAVRPEAAGGLLLVASALLTLRTREHPSSRPALLAAALLALLPWLRAEYLLPGAVTGAALVIWLLRAERRFVALVAAEIMLLSVVVYVTVSERLYGGPTPHSATAPGQDGVATSFPAGYLERLPRLIGALIDRDQGLLRWAPFLALAVLAAWLLWRSRRERLALLVPDQRTAEVSSGLLLAVCAALLALAALVAPAWPPGLPPPHLGAALPAAAALCAWGLRRHPRTGAALAALTLLASAALYASLRLGEGSWSSPATAAPWWPAERIFPVFGDGPAAAAASAALVALALAALVACEWRRWRRTPAAG